MGFKLRRYKRKGTSAVEVGIALPVFLTFLWGIFALGHARMISTSLRAATRDAARLGAVEGSTNSDITDRINEMMAPLMDTSELTIYIKDASVFESTGTMPATNGEVDSLPNINVANADPLQMVLVRATVPYDNVGVLSLPYTSALILTGQAVVRHE